jgi:hypothetical protein
MIMKEVRNWPKQAVNHTNIEQVKIDLFQMQIIVHAHMITTVITLFATNLNFMVHHGIARVWKNLLVSYPTMLTMIYLLTLIVVYVVPFNPSTHRSVQVNEIFKITFFIFIFIRCL